MYLEFQQVGFTHQDAVQPLFTGLSVTFGPGWTGVVGPNGVGKTTLLELACGLLAPERGRVLAGGAALLCPQRTDRAPGLLEDFLGAEDGEARRLHGQLQLGPLRERLWETLSHGERKRAQIGVALWQHPQILALDEPTNHIDAAARELLQQALASFRGLGLLVSHDRQLLDALCGACLFLQPDGARLRPGGYTEGAAQASLERASLWQQRREARRRLQDLEGAARERRHRASSADQRRSKRGIPVGDHDAKARINLARLSGKDGTDGRLAAQLDARVGRLRAQLDDLPSQGHQETGIWLPGGRSQRDRLLLLPPGDIVLPGGGTLRHEGLELGPADRVGVTGPNGAGKTLLIRHLLGQLQIPADKVLYLPQELDPAEASDLRQRLALLPRRDLGLVMTVVARLGSAAPQLLASTAPSPGELRKLKLALGILAVPHLIVLDEPTNHLDLVAVECLESALADCPCALLLVSHDLVFLSHLTTRRWHVEGGRVGEGP